MMINNTLQNRLLDELVKDHVPVTVYPANDLEIRGVLLAHDDCVVLFAENCQHRIIYKHAISRIYPIKGLQSWREE